MFFAALILYKSTVSDSLEPSLYEETVTIVEADSMEEAKVNSLAFARSQEHSYKNENGETVQWTLVKVVDVANMLEQHLKHGTDVYSRHFTNFDDYKRFESLIKKTFSSSDSK